ncbi:MAG: hypothetical protein H6825_15750 [Planctomycetes bacterium]|nr:hypothetical protein [Planctomycetota bacterium]
MTPAGKASKSKAASKSSSKKSTTKGGKSAGKAAAAAAPKSSTSVPRRGTRARLLAVLEKLDKQYGAVALPETRDVLEKAVCLVLREVTTPQNVLKALEVLRADFVDWNEVRVSSPSELSRLLSGSSRASTLRRWDVHARRLREMVDQVYNDKNVATLEFLLEAKPKEQIEYLEDLDDLGLYNAHALVQWLSGDDKLSLVSSELAKAAQALGLTDSAAVTKVKKELSALCPPEHLVAVQAHLNQLGALEPDEWPSATKDFLG